MGCCCPSLFHQLFSSPHPLLRLQRRRRRVLRAPVQEPLEYLDQRQQQVPRQKVVRHVVPLVQLAAVLDRRLQRVERAPPVARHVLQLPDRDHAVLRRVHHRHVLRLRRPAHPVEAARRLAAHQQQARHVARVHDAVGARQRGGGAALGVPDEHDVGGAGAQAQQLLVDHGDAVAAVAAVAHAVGGDEIGDHRAPAERLRDELERADEGVVGADQRGPAVVDHDLSLIHN